jgi:hypothetical protein
MFDTSASLTAVKSMGSTGLENVDQKPAARVSVCRQGSEAAAEAPLNAYL